MYGLRLYGLPPGPDEEHEGLQSAIDSALVQLKNRETPGFAEIRLKINSSVVWTAYRTQDGSVVHHHHDREPGSD